MLWSRAGSIEGDVKRKHFSLRQEGENFLTSSPRVLCGTARWEAGSTFRNNSHIDGLSTHYDAAGDLLYGGATNYAYDSESRIITTANTVSGVTASYVYDAMFDFSGNGSDLRAELSYRI